MAEVLLFHHAFGRTAGVRAFADALRQAGHIVHVPDLYAGPSTPLRTGRIFADLDAGVRHAQQVGLDTIIERGVRAAEALPNALVYAGFSLGVLPAQKLAQTRAGASGALLFDACVPPGTFGGPWPRGVPVQIHGMDADPIFVGDGDLDAARALVSSVEGAELFLYKGRGHIFADNSLASYDEAAARLLTERVIRFLQQGKGDLAAPARSHRHP
jgi:dienelactone hydrolase